MMNMIPTRSMRLMDEPFFPFDDSFFRPMFNDRASFKTDIRDMSDKYVIDAELPGTERENVSVSVKKGVLTISVEVKNETEDKSDNYICRERRHGSMKRSFTLDGIDEANITAEFKNGLLTVSLPKETENDETRSIEIA